MPAPVELKPSILYAYVTADLSELPEKSPLGLRSNTRILHVQNRVISYDETRQRPATSMGKPSYGSSHTALCPSVGLQNIGISKASTRLTECNLTRPIRAHWFAQYNFTRALCPEISLGSDDNYYLVAILNQSSYTGFVERSQDPDDELMAAARDVLGITEDLEPTLQWYRYPVDWEEYSPYGLSKA